MHRKRSNSLFFNFKSGEDHFHTQTVLVAFGNKPQAAVLNISIFKSYPEPNHAVSWVRCRDKSSLGVVETLHQIEAAWICTYTVPLPGEPSAVSMQYLQPSRLVWPFWILGPMRGDHVLPCLTPCGHASVSGRLEDTAGWLLKSTNSLHLMRSFSHSSVRKISKMR